MGIIEEETLYMARKIALFNSEVIFFVKNSLTYLTEKKLRDLLNEKEKIEVLIKNSYNADTNLIVANVENNDNHDLTKIDVELIQEVLKEGVREPSITPP